MERQLAALASQLTDAHVPVDVRNFVAAHCTHAPFVCSWYPEAHDAAVVLLAQVAALAVHGLLLPHEPLASKNLFAAQLTQVPFV